MARRQAEKSAQTREELMTAARKLFKEKGYENTSIADIVEEAGYSVGAFYKHFKTKTDIVKPIFINLVNTSTDHEVKYISENCKTIQEVMDYMLERRSRLGEANREFAELYTVTLFNKTAGPDPENTGKLLVVVKKYLKEFASGCSDEVIESYANIIITLLTNYWVSNFNPNIGTMSKSTIRATLYAILDICRNMSFGNYIREGNWSSS